jgi:hypothetical protein
VVQSMPPRRNGRWDAVAPESRFWPKVHVTHGCWEWTGAVTSNGYGRFWDGERVCWAHRAAWELFVGPIPKDLQIDHLCRNRKCVRIEHLRVVTVGENLRAGYGWSGVNVRKTHCPKGHFYSAGNTAIVQGSRVCITCRRLKDRLRRPAKGIRRSRYGQW